MRDLCGQTVCKEFKEANKILHVKQQKYFNHRNILTGQNLRINSDRVAGDT